MFANLNINFSLWVGPFVCPSVTKNLISSLATGNENRRHISSMHICMYACTHVHIYACMHVCMYAHMHVCMYGCMLLKRGLKAPKRAHRVPQELEGWARSVQIFQYLNCDMNQMFKKNIPARKYPKKGTRKYQRGMKPYELVDVNISRVDLELCELINEYISNYLK